MSPKRVVIFKIGITGNICTGKTTVRHALQHLGVNVMDVDEMALNLLSDNPQRLAIRLTEHFGSEVIDNRGRLSRKKLTAVLYADPGKKAFFEEKLNPVMREEIKRFLYGPMGSNFRAVEHAQLLESDTQHLYDEIWMVSARPNVQASRLAGRDHLTHAEANRLIDAQWPQEKKIALSNRVIDNSGDLQQTESQVRKALNEIKHGIFKAGI